MSEEVEKSKKGRSKSEERMVIKDPYMEPYEIRVDTNNYVVYDTSKSAATGAMGYFTDVPGALRNIVKRKLASRHITMNLSEYLKTIIDEREAINKIISTLTI